MRATRAYIAGFGTTSFLVGASICMLIVVGALVAFNAWPGSGLGSSHVDRLVVDDSGHRAAPVSVRSRPSAAIAAAAAAAATVAPKPIGPPVVGRTTSLGAATPGTTGGPGGPTGGARTPAGDAVQSATDAAGSGVGQASPEAGDAVKQTGQAVNQTVQGATQSASNTVTNAVDGLTDH